MPGEELIHGMILCSIVTGHLSSYITHFLNISHTRGIVGGLKVCKRSVDLYLEMCKMGPLVHMIAKVL